MSPPLRVKRSKIDFGPALLLLSFPFNIFKPHNKMSAVIFMTPHANIRVGPQHWTPSCGRCRFRAEDILLPLPNKSKMCQLQFSLIGPKKIFKNLTMILRSEEKSNFDVQLCEESYFWEQFGIIRRDLELAHVSLSSLKAFALLHTDSST